MAWVTAAASRLRAELRVLARIRYRLLLVNALVAAVPVIGISFAERHERQLLAGLEHDMIHQAQLVRAVVLHDGAPGDLAAREPMLRAAARDTRTRIRLLDHTGAVVADSHRGGPPEGPEQPVPRLLGADTPRRAAEVPRPVELAERREVRAALAGRYGSATRLWDNQDRVYLFVALPIPRRASPPVDSAGSSILRRASPPALPAEPAGLPPPVDSLDEPAPRRASPPDGVDGVANVAGVDSVDGVVYVTRSTHDVKLQLYQLRAWLLRLLIATLAITALLSLLLATTIARPLGRLTRRAQRIAERRPADGADRLAARADEIGELARAVDAMTSELERRAAEARSLAADISHEFKTPLAGIRGAAELLRDGAADEPEPRERFLAMILDDAARLDRQVSRLLELARVDDDRGAVLPVDLGALARACAARPWPVRVEVEVAGDAVVLGRTGQLTAAIDNLVANATQHAAPATPVHVRIERRERSLRLTVDNHGPALSPAAQARVWDRFYSTRAAAGGSGLGLAIVRSVATAHGGSVGVRCAGGVTSFWFELAR